MSQAGRSGSIPPGNTLKISPLELGTRRKGNTRKRWPRAPSWCSYAMTQRKYFARTFSLRLKNCPCGPDAKRAETVLPPGADDRALVLGPSGAPRLPLEVEIPPARAAVSWVARFTARPPRHSERRARLHRKKPRARPAGAGGVRFAGESKVKMIHPSRISLAEAVGCRVVFILPTERTTAQFRKIPC
jgi:hypothetical protein